ncbi:HNH endonuclease signature motif containing protein [Aeromicrobium halocynthiae]|uniref:HNH endonuclease signature motif containing protein n=1 Tax=Aeromicrobium halocynthiae TaxID=560557 RepID=A0ABN2W5A1_9ACTN
MAVAPLELTTTSVVDKLAVVHDLLSSIDTDDYARLSPDDQRSSARSLARLKARVAAHELAAVAAVESAGTARREGAASTGSLLAGDFGGDRRGADGLVRQAKRIQTAPVSHAAQAAGELTAKQATVIGKALDLLPDETDDSVRRSCEAQLVADAPRLDLPRLTRLADRVIGSHLACSDDPEALDAAEDDIVAERERRAWNASSFWMSPPTADGLVKGGFTIPEAQAAHLRVALDALCAPQVEITAPGHVSRRTGEVLLDERPDHSRRQGWAFAHLCELLPVDRLPQTNNLGPVLTVNMDLDVLSGRLKVANASTGERLSAGQARRMACEHRLLPAVFDGDSLPLDLGRSRRLFSLHQRRALEMRDHGCVFPQCDRPPGWCVVHHANEHWAAGGTTNLTDGVLLCPHHHRTLHADGWHVRFTHDHVPELIPPAHLDPHRRPRRHQRFREPTHT